MTIATLLFAFIAIPSSPSGSVEPVMLDFTATWCGPCRQMRPAVEQLVQKGYPIKPIDLDQNRELAERYEVTAVPTFVVIDPRTGRDLGRISGARDATDLANFYQQARAKYHPPASTPPRAESRAEAEADESQDADQADSTQGDEDLHPQEVTPPVLSANPKPWETIVRIKVHGSGAIGFGSGTIIHSTPEESIILTCAHIFKLEHGPQAPPSRFPRKITIDLFDGNLGGPKRNQVHYSHETFVGQAVDYDFARDVGLIRIRPGRRLPYARVVPAHWKPKARMGMMTVGCSEGQDATAWHTMILNPAFRGLAGNEAYEAIECKTAPKQGRSGGGLFTSDGYVAGVCDFAEPRGDHGLYASPTSIYHVLDRNRLTALYSPRRGGPEMLLAKEPTSPRRAGPEYARAQSPDPEDSEGVTLPPPQMVGLQLPESSDQPARKGSRKSGNWLPAPSARTTDIRLDPSANSDHFETGEPMVGRPNPVENEAVDHETKAQRKSSRGVGKWRVSRSSLIETGSSPRG
ncbi:MAG: trypsin-like peptidase domain-containing protein [Isosphaeraceae bacterium]